MPELCLKKIRKGFFAKLQKQLILSDMNTYKQFLTEEIKAEISSYYIQQNHSLKESQQYFKTKYGICPASLIKIMRVFGVHKPKDLHVQQIKNAKRVKHGSENYNGHVGFKFEYSAEEEQKICDRYLAGENI